MEKRLALIVDDEPDIRELLEITLARMDIDSHSAGDISGARVALNQHHYDICLADMRLPDGDGIDLVRHISDNYPQTPVAMITAHGSMETAIEALKAGAFDFVSKPVDLSVLRQLVDTALQLPKSMESGACNTASTDQECPLKGKSAPMQAIRSMISKLGRSQAPVYISGESGTGKELAARLIHQSSPRADHPFVAVNCGAIPQELMESELFGHKKGSFTGAVSDKEGLFQAAYGGTLFLDEVADLPLPLQVKLLRVIQEKTVRPIGSATETPTNVRLICATHQDLGKLVQEGTFRKDLFYRLNVIELRMPPLRELPEDIPELIDHLLERIAGEYGQAKPELSKGAFKALLNYPFPGNVRELENILERSFALCEDNKIRKEDLGLTLHSLPELSDSAKPSLPSEGLEEHLAQVERELLLKALEETRWNKTAAAEKLGISFRAFRYRLSKLDLEQEE